MNCITSATETSLRLPEIPMGWRLAVWRPDRASPCKMECGRLLPARQLDQALQRAQLAILGGEEPRGEEGRRGMGGEQVEQVAVLGPQDRLVVQQLEQHEGADDLRLHPQGH